MSRGSGYSQEYCVRGSDKLTVKINNELLPRSGRVEMYFINLDEKTRFRSNALMYVTRYSIDFTTNAPDQ
jgi:hypothetical protein